MAVYSFNDAAIASVVNSVESFAMASGRFDTVNGHEPKSAPTGVHFAVWLQTMEGITGSGLKNMSGYLVLNGRIYMPFRSEPFDAIDPKIMSAAAEMVGAVCGDFDFGGSANVRNIDILGSYGTALTCGAGYVEIDRTVFRVMTIVIPVIINDMFAYVSGD
jgi:hypothetical protein